MPRRSELVVALSRAYALTEIIPLQHPTIRDALASLDRMLQGLEVDRVEAFVSERGIMVDGEDVEDSQGLTREFARDLRAVGARRLRVPNGVEARDVECFITALRDTVTGNRTDLTDGLEEQAGVGVELILRDGALLSFAAGTDTGAPARAQHEPVPSPRAEGLARSIGRLFDEEGGAGPDPEAEQAGSPEEAEATEEVVSPEEVEATDESVAGRAGNGGPEPDEEAPELEEQDLESFRTGPVVDRARDLLETPSGEREAGADAVRQEAEEALSDGRVDDVVNGVHVLARGGRENGDDEAVDLARELSTSPVVARSIARLSMVWDEMDRAELVEEMAILSDVMAPVLAEALTEARDRRARRSYMDAMLAMGEDGVREVVRMVEDERWFVVRNGVAILGEVGGERAVEQLTTTLAHEDPRVRRETVLALARVGGEDAGMLLLGMLEDPDEDVRAASIRALGVLKVEKALRPLLALLDGETDDDVVAQLLGSLGQIGDPGAVPAIEKRASSGLFSRSSRDVRIAAYRALAHIGTPRARKLLDEGTADRDAEVRKLVQQLVDEA